MTSRSSHSVTQFLTRLQNLPAEQQQQVIDFVEFLTQKYSNSPQQGTGRVLGLHQGMGWVSDDFNTFLPDEFWLEET